MKKLVVSSFYNTLINYEEAIPVSTMLEIERIRNKKILFAVCTNRLYTEVLDYNRDFPFLDYIIALNGSIIYDVKKKKCLFKKKLPKTIIKKIINKYPHNNLYFYTANNIYTDITNLEEDIYKIEIEYNKKLDLKKIADLKINLTTFEYNQKSYLEITSNLTNNYIGLEKISNKEKITKDEIVAIVANEADLSIIKNVKDYYTVKNCCSSLKKISKKETLSNNLKGVENILKKL